MSAYDLIQGYATESKKAKPAFEFKLEDYFSIDANLEAHADAIQHLAGQVAAADFAMNKLEATGEKLPASVAEFVNEFAAMTCFAAIQNTPLYTFLALEAEGEEGEEGANKPGLKERFKKARENALGLLKGLYTNIKAHLRKRKTGTDKLVKLIDEVLADPRTLDMEIVPMSFVVDGDIAKPADLKALTELLKKHVKDPLAVDGEFKLLGDVTKTFVVETGEKKVAATVQATKPTELKKAIALNEGEVKAFLEAAKEAAEYIGSIDHKPAEAAAEAEIKGIDEEEVVKVVATAGAVSKIIRELTVAMPAHQAGKLAQCVKVIKKSGKVVEAGE